MPYLYRNQRKIYYVMEPAMHRQNAETIILLHTNVTDHTIYDRIVPFIREEFNLVRYDLSGFGLSELGDQEISLDMYVEDFIFLVQSLNITSFYIVAVGYGGLIAFEYSRYYGEMVKKMVLMTMPCFPEETLDTVRAHRKNISSDGTRIPIDTILKKATLLAEDDSEYIRLHHIMNQLPVPIYTKIMELTISANTIGYMQKNTTPTLILAGEREIVFPQNLLAINCAYLPGHQYAVVPNASSFLMIDQPEITAKLTIEFFKATIQLGRYNDDMSTSIYNDVRLYTQDYYHTKINPTQRTNQIQIDLLYSFRVLINGNPVMKGLNQRYAKNMLIYLLLHPTTTREEMCENLWPEDSLIIAKKKLRVYLSYLKHLLNSYSLEQPILILDREYIHLNGEVMSDVITLISDLNQANHLESNKQKIILAKKTINQFHSPNYLTTIYDHWFQNIREKIEIDLIHLTTWLGKWLVQNGNEQEGLHYLTKSLALFDDNIKIYDTIIDLYRSISNEERMQYWMNEKSKL